MPLSSLLTLQHWSTESSEFVRMLYMSLQSKVTLHSLLNIYTPVYYDAVKNGKFTTHSLLKCNLSPNRKCVMIFMKEDSSLNQCFNIEDMFRGHP